MAYINAEQTKAIRKALKERFPEHKFSVKIGAGKSDIITDYFHTAYYIHLHIGAWNKPFQIKEVA